MLAAAAAHAAAGPSYVGAAACAKCHAAIHSQWSHSRHSKMVQPATAASVQGDFNRGVVKLRGQPYALRQRNGAFYITESYLAGKPVEHRVEYTLGNRRIQLYLATLADGRIIVLPPSWDILRKEWFHNLDIDDPEEEPGVQTQIWNKSCYSCHVSQQEKNFDIDKNAYKTAWLDFGTNCERCHGPGSEHVANYSSATPPKGPARDIVLQTRLDAKRNTMVCAQCHSFRDIYVQGYAAGADYYDYFMPVLEFNLADGGDPAYWPDGRTRRFSNDAFGLWQSECYLKGGVTCVACHVNAHQPEIDRNPQFVPMPARCARVAMKRSAKRLRRTRTMRPPAPAALAWSATCRAQSIASRRKSAITRCRFRSPKTPSGTIYRTPATNATKTATRSGPWRAHESSGTSLDSRRKLIRRADAFAAAHNHYFPPLRIC